MPRSARKRKSAYLRQERKIDALIAKKQTKQKTNTKIENEKKTKYIGDRRVLAPGG